MRKRSEYKRVWEMFTGPEDLSVPLADKGFLLLRTEGNPNISAQGECDRVPAEYLLDLYPLEGCKVMVTETHSIDGNPWVAVCEMKVGETLDWTADYNLKITRFY